MRGTRVLCAAVVVACLAATGCSFDQKPVIEKRAKEFAAALLASPDSAVALVDPVFVRAQGEGAVKVRLHLMSGILKAARITADDVQITSITVGEDGKTATVSVTVPDKSAPGKNSPAQSYKFVKADDGKWYIAF